MRLPELGLFSPLLVDCRVSNALALGEPGVRHGIWIAGTERQCVEADKLNNSDRGVLTRLYIQWTHVQGLHPVFWNWRRPPSE
jgi:hypothetical protein